MTEDDQDNAVPDLKPEPGMANRPLTPEELAKDTPPNHPGGRLPKKEPRDTPGRKLGTFIRGYMLQKHMTREMLAERSGIPLNTLNNIIMGYPDCPSLSNIQGISRALGISPLNIFAATSIVTERDVENFLANQMAPSRIRQDPAFLLITNALANLSPAQRQAALAAMVTMVTAISQHAA